MSELTNQEQGYVEIGGAQIFYEAAGSGDALLLIHAGVADLRMWDDQFEMFAQHYRVIRYDLRGYGRTVVPASPFGYHGDAAELLTALGIERAAVVGISFGGRVALDLALAFPERVAALVLGAPSVGGEQPSEAVQDFGEAEEALLEQGDLEAASELNVRMWVDGPKRGPDAVAASVRDRVRLMQREAFEVPFPPGASPEGLQPPARERLGEVGVPTLILVGDQDLPEKVALAETLAQEIAGTQLRIIEGAGHMLSMEKPDEFGHLVVEFLTQHPTATGDAGASHMTGDGKLTPETIRAFVLAGHGDLNQVKNLLAEQPSLLNAAHEWRPDDTETALQAAAHVGNRAIAEYLLSQGAPLDICTAAMLAQRDALFGFLSADPEAIHATGAHRIPLLAHAALSEDAELVRELLARGAREGISFAVSNAVWKGSSEVVAVLLESGEADLGWQNFQGKTPLAMATEQGNAKLAQMLREAGATE